MHTTITKRSRGTWNQYLGYAMVSKELVLKGGIMVSNVLAIYPNEKMVVMHHYLNRYTPNLWVVLRFMGLFNFKSDLLKLTINCFCYLFILMRV